MNKAIISAPNTERAIIAALLADVDTFPTVKEQGLRADDLTDPFLAEVFRKYEQGFTSLPQLLDVMPDKLDELLTIQGEAGNLANVPYQAAALKEIAVRRELCRIAESVPKLAGNQDKALLPVLNRLVSAFLEQKSRLETRRRISRFHSDEIGHLAGFLIDKPEDSIIYENIDEIRNYMKSIGKRGGSARTKKQIEAHKKAAERLNSSYTPEKRKAAAQKRLDTLKKKKEKS